MSNLRRSFDRAVAASRHRALIPGVLGKPDGAGGYTVAVSGRPNHVYVRVSTAGSESVTIARNVNRVAHRANLPVLMELEIGGTYTIVSEDPAYYAAATPNDTTNVFGVAYHTHRSDTALAYESEAKMLDVGRVFYNATYTVYVKPLRYYYAGAWQYWTGGSLNLAAYMPTTSTKWGWILVGIDPTANTPIAVAGAEVATEAELLIADLASIAFTGYIPLVAIAAAEADTDLSDYTRYYDASEWHGGLLLQFNDGEGSSAAVTTATPADGTSAFAARRDHAHGLADDAVTTAKIADDAVTNALLANMATETVKGRLTSGTGDPEDITIADLATAIAAEISIGALDDLSDVEVIAPAHSDILSYSTVDSLWHNGPFDNKLANNTAAIQAPRFEIPLMNSNGEANRFNESGATDYPLSWVEGTAAWSTTDTPSGYWTLRGTSGILDYDYAYQMTTDIEGDLATDEWLSTWFFPIMLRDSRPGQTLDYYIGVYAADGSNPDLDAFVRLHINWNYTTEEWTMRGESKDGTTQTDGDWLTLARWPMQDLWLRFAIKNDTNKTVRVYIGTNQLTMVHANIYEDEVSSSVTWGNAVLYINRERTVGAGPDDVIMLGGMDFSTDE